MLNDLANQLQEARGLKEIHEQDYLDALTALEEEHAEYLYAKNRATELEREIRDLLASTPLEEIKPKGKTKLGYGITATRAKIYSYEKAAAFKYAFEREPSCLILDSKAFDALMSAREKANAPLPDCVEVLEIVKPSIPKVLDFMVDDEN